ncbi:MAG: nicotinate-nucleotide--dimethylbenzimidazole phosphoribosyltransferase [Pseudomonadota bacterium]|nr:nicotinate-nucleotide--dimethylbenzimidazole phosphoribosyltransferase [Pseudomonadota bacterium]
MKVHHLWPPGPPATLDLKAGAAARARQARLTKPPGALGELESIAIRLAAMQGRDRPELERVQIALFAADHGVANRGVSAFPQSVTAQMVRNIAGGGAAVSVLARELGAGLEVVDLGCAADPGILKGIVRVYLGPGTADLSRQAAMTPEQLDGALRAGVESAQRTGQERARLYIGGEMGIGNTTAAAAVACALLDEPARALAGPGTGLDADGVRRKAVVVEEALVLHRDHLEDPTEVLRHVGGFEIAALTGAYAACANMGVPVLVDGFISSVAALAAVRLQPGVRDWLLFSHVSAEPGHRLVLKALDAKPLLDLGMRLGEGSGAAVAVPLLRMACALHNGMATFEEAGVSGGHP